MSEPSSLPLFAPAVDPGPSFADLLRQVAPHQLPGRGDVDTTVDARHPARHHRRRRSATRDGVVMAGDRRATAGYTIASRRIEKVFPADDFSGVAIAGAAGPGGRDGEAVPGAARALREGAGRRAQPRGQGQPARPARARRTCPPRCRASSVVPLFAGYDTAPRTRPRVLLRRHRRPLRRARLPGPGLGQRPRPQLDQGRLARRHAARRRSSTSRSRRCSPPPTRTSPPADPTSCAASSRRSRSSTPTASAPSTDDDVAAASSRGPSAEARS